MAFNLKHLLQKSNGFISQPKPIQKEVDLVQEITIPEVPEPEIVLHTHEVLDEEIIPVVPTKKKVKRKVPLNPLSDE
jgi:hypothetical protein